MVCQAPAMDLLLKRVSDKQTDKLIRLKKVIGKKENLKWKLFWLTENMMKEDIPMSSVVVQDRQPSSISESPSTSSYNIESQELIGLGPLRSASKLFIKQRIRASDICALLTGCEVSILGIYFDVENSSYSNHRQTSHIWLWSNLLNFYTYNSFYTDNLTWISSFSYLFCAQFCCQTFSEGFIE